MYPASTSSMGGTTVLPLLVPEGPFRLHIWNWGPKTIPYVLLGPNSVWAVSLDPLGVIASTRPAPGYQQSPDPAPGSSA